MCFPLEPNTLSWPRGPKFSYFKHFLWEHPRHGCKISTCLSHQAWPVLWSLAWSKMGKPYRYSYRWGKVPAALQLETVFSSAAHTHLDRREHSMMNSIKETCFIPQRHDSLPSANSPNSSASQVGNLTTFLLYPTSPNFPDRCAQHNEIIQILFWYKILHSFWSSPKMLGWTQAKGLMHNHNLKLQQWHSSDFFAEVWAKCFDEQDENGHSRFDPVHSQVIQYESYFLQTSSMNFVNMVFLLSAVKKPPTPHT